MPLETVITILTAFCHLFSPQRPKWPCLFTTLQKYVSAKNPGYVIKPIIGDGYCAIRSFQEGLSSCYGKAESLDSLLVELRSEIMENYDLY